jgi:hypothetical protein
LRTYKTHSVQCVPPYLWVCAGMYILVRIYQYKYLIVDITT